MSLEGRLSDFTLEEILQLIALQQKTGVLNVEASYPMVLYFESGELVSYRDRRGAGTDQLQAFLRKYGFFSSESWEHIDFVQRNSSLDLTEILINEGLLSPEALARVQQDTAQEHLNHGMLLRDGRYAFTAGREVLMGLKGRVRMKVEGLLMEAARRIDEMPVLQERYGGDRVKIRRTDKEADPENLSSGMRHLLSIVGNESTVKAVVGSARMSEFDTLQVLEELRQKGLVLVMAPPKAVKAEGEVQPEEERGAQRVGQRAAALWTLVMLGLAALLWLFDPLAAYRVRPTAGTQRAAELAGTRQLQRIESALFLYQAARGGYPQNLQALVEARLLEPTALKGTGAVEYTVAPDGRSYSVHPARLNAPQ